LRFTRLFELRINHAAYPGGRCADIRIEPRTAHPTGVRTLARHRLLARARPHGLEVLAQVDDGADVFRSALPVASKLVFGFELRVTGSEFATVTDLQAWAGQDQPVYRATGPASGPLQLVEDAPERQLGVAALLEVTGLTLASLTTPPTFTLELAARRVPWVYYLSSARPELPRIEDRASEPVAFTREQLTLANTSASADPIGRRLLERHPDRSCYRVRSAQPIAIQRGVRRPLSLYLGDEQLIRELPLPSIHNSTLLSLGLAEPRQALYHVVEY
jgi:hypothetical protein